MANPTNLSEYYASQGQALPSVSSRSGLAGKAGIEGYKGTAEQNTKLLGYLQSNGLGGNSTGSTLPNNVPSTPPTIPIETATTPQKGMGLPNKPQQSAPTDVYSGAAAYLATLPQTGVAGLDQTLAAMQNRPGQLAQQYDISNKQTKANELQKKLDVFNEGFRVEEEKVRTNGALGAEIANARINELERKRAFTAGTYAIEAAAAQNDFQGAQQLMNQQAQLELEPLKMRYDFFKDMYNRTEDQKFQRLMKAEDRAYQEKRDALNAENSAILMGMQNPGDATGQLGLILGPGGSKVGEGTRTAIGNVLSVVEIAKALANDNASGNFPGIRPGIRTPAKLASEAAIQNRQAIEALNLKTQIWASGASLTKDQIAQVERFTPKKSDTDKLVRSKLNGLIDFMYADTKGKLLSAGITSFNPTKSDFFGKYKSDPLQLGITTTTVVSDPLELGF